MKNILYLEHFKLSVFLNRGFIYLYIYNKTYYCLIKVNKKLKVNMINNKTIEVKNVENTNLIKRINLFLKQFYFYEFTKIKFTGKGYKIKKNTTQSMVLLFNRAHTTTIWWKNLSIKKLKKYKIYIKCSFVQKKVIDTIVGVRPINIFTKKGLRKSRQILLKKKGKK